MTFLYLVLSIYVLWYLITRTVGAVINYQDWMFLEQLTWQAALQAQCWLTLPIMPESWFIAEYLYYSVQRD